MSWRTGLRSRPFEGRRREARERVRGRQDEEVERRRDPGLDGEHVGPERRRQVGAEDRDEGAEQRQDQDPQEHRALMVPPDARELVDERHRRMGVLEHVRDREVGDHIGRRQRRERRGDERELSQGRRRGDAHQHGVALPRAGDRRRALDEGERQRQHQGVVADLGDHQLFTPSSLAASSSRRSLSGSLASARRPSSSAACAFAWSPSTR